MIIPIPLIPAKLSNILQSPLPQWQFLDKKGDEGCLRLALKGGWRLRRRLLDGLDGLDGLQKTPGFFVWGLCFFV